MDAEIKEEWGLNDEEPEGAGAPPLPVEGEVLPPIQPMDVGEPQDIRCTDIGNGKRLAYLCGHEVAYCRERGAWFVWDGKTWKEDHNGVEVSRKAKQVAKAI